MARVNNLRGTSVEILMGDGATPEVFTVLCGITTRSITTQVNTSDAFNQDCADPEDVPVRELITSGKQWDMRGSGQMNRDLFPDLLAAIGETKNYRFFIRAKVGEVAADNPLNGYLGGPGKITTHTLNGNNGDMVGIDLAIASDGAWAWSDVVVA
jgi:2-polyprenyl-6-methoxyphenol hydroxylase-like FAD-dependent oxidoreductase